MPLTKPYAVFIGWQESDDGDHMPLFNIMGDHERKGSTVDGNTLLREGIDIPPVTPCLFPKGGK